MSDQVYGVGLDVGTMNLVAARQTGENVETRRLRNAFLDLPKGHRKMLAMGNFSHFVRQDDLVIVGDAAYDLANMFNREVRRPLQSGLVSSGEMDALEILARLIQELLGKPRVQGERCYFSVPAAPVDAPEKDVIYHQGVLRRIIADCGYTPTPGNEAMAIIFSECSKEMFSGISASFGSGMANVALAISTVEGMSFSTSRSGDWLDHGVAKAVGSTAARICSLKEQGVDLRAPKGREQEALALYYQNLIEYTLDHIVQQFGKTRGQIVLPRPIPFVVSGGTSKPTGFLELFRQVFEAKKSRFPFEVSEIRAAGNPLDAVARGLLIQAAQDDE